MAQFFREDTEIAITDMDRQNPTMNASNMPKTACYTISEVWGAKRSSAFVCMGHSREQHVLKRPIRYFSVGKIATF